MTRTWVGRRIRVGAQPYEVIGVAPPDFAGLETIGTAPSLFVPTMQAVGFGGRSLFTAWGSSWLTVVGRLADGVSLDQAEAAMDVTSTRLRNADSVNQGIQVLLAQGVGLTPDERDDANRMATILVLIVGLVLLLTCTNVANLFLARATGRGSEVGVRMALGAGRGRLVRQLVTESSLVALLATALTIPLLWVTGDLLPALFPYPVSVSLGADVRVWLFLLTIGLATGPFLRSRAGLGRLTEGRGFHPCEKERRRADGSARAFATDWSSPSSGCLSGWSPGRHSWAGASRTRAPPIPDSSLLAWWRARWTSSRVDGTPRPRRGMSSIGPSWQRPMDGQASRPPRWPTRCPLTGGHARATVRPAGREEPRFEAEYVVVGPRYFETMDIEIVQGRPLLGFDDEPDPVVVVNQALADMYWPGENPIGQELEGPGGTWRVVGVSADVQMRSLRARANPAVYYPAARDYAPFMVLHLRATPGTDVAPATIRQIVAAVDAQLPVGTVVDLSGVLAASMGETRTFGWLVSAFATLALLLAAVGLYGLVSYGAAQRVRGDGHSHRLGRRTRITGFDWCWGGRWVSPSWVPSSAWWSRSRWGRH